MHSALCRKSFAMLFHQIRRNRIDYEEEKADYEGKIAEMKKYVRMQMQKCYIIKYRILNGRYDLELFQYNYSFFLSLHL